MGSHCMHVVVARVPLYACGGCKEFIVMIVFLIVLSLMCAEIVFHKWHFDRAVFLCPCVLVWYVNWATLNVCSL